MNSQVVTAVSPLSTGKERNGKSTRQIGKASLLAPNYIPMRLRQINSEVVTAVVPLSTGREGKENSMRQLGKTSLLAPNYIPLHLRQINSQVVTTVVHAEPLPVLLEHVKRVYHSAMVSTHKCSCGIPHDEIPPWEMLKKTLTHKIKKNEIFFAIGPRALQRAAPNFERIFQNIDSISGQNVYDNNIRCLLREEHQETLVLYERYTQFNSHVQTIPGVPFRAQIEAHGICNARPPLQSGDTILLRPHQPVEFLRSKRRPAEWIEIRAKVIQTVRGKGIKKDKVILTWMNPKEYSFLANQRFAVRFLPSAIVYERSLAALDWLKKISPGVAKDLLFPTEAPRLPDYTPVQDEHDDDLNEKQSFFVNMVMTRTKHPSREKVRSPMILTGPAGTGKTRALLVSILKVLKMDENYKKRILVCTPSHTSSDVVARRLGKFMSSQTLFRLYDSNRPVETVPADMLRFSRQGLNGEFILPPVAELLGFQVIVSTCSDAHLLYLAGITNASLRARRNCLQHFIHLTVQASHLEMKGKILGVNETHFTHLFIDEAAQATEPESLIPLSVVIDDSPDTVKVEIVLAGDPRQLSIDVYSPWALDDLQKSLLERLLRLPVAPLGGGRPHLMGPPTKDTWANMDELIEYAFDKEDDKEYLSVFLTMSYRGHPSFLMMPSKLFYFDKLRSARLDLWKADDKWCPILRKIEAMSIMENPGCNKQNAWPIHFRAVVGRDRSAAVESCWGANSWSNHEEAIEILKITVKLVQEGVTTQSIGIMAAFRAQVVWIRRILREQNLGMVNVGMVEDFQAAEREVIILSLTRSTEEFLLSDFKRRVGIFNQPKRTNVALTRAANLLIVVGNPLIMEKDIIWRDWLLFCRENGLWYGENVKTTMDQPKV